MGKFAPETLQSAHALFTRLQEIVELVHRVVAKYPGETLPERLAPYRYPTHVLRINTWPEAPEELIVTLTGHSLPRVFMPDEYVWIPVAWLTACQSEITKAVRNIYWADADQRRQPELQRRWDRIVAAQNTLALTAERLEREKTEYENLRAAADKKRRARA